MAKIYRLGGFAGLVQQRRNHETGTVVGVYHADQAGLDPESGKWATVCEPHSRVVNHETLALARDHASAPSGWCGVCAGSETADDDELVSA